MLTTRKPDEQKSVEIDFDKIRISLINAILQYRTAVASKKKNNTANEQTEWLLIALTNLEYVDKNTQEVGVLILCDIIFRMNISQQSYGLFLEVTKQWLIGTGYLTPYNIHTLTSPIIPEEILKTITKFSHKFSPNYTDDTGFLMFNFNSAALHFYKIILNNSIPLKHKNISDKPKKKDKTFSLIEVRDESIKHKSFNLSTLSIFSQSAEKAFIEGATLDALSCGKFFAKQAEPTMQRIASFLNRNDAVILIKVKKGANSKAEKNAAHAFDVEQAERRSQKTIV